MVRPLPPFSRALSDRTRRAVVAGKESRYRSIRDLKSSQVGISKPGSGTEIMAYVMARQQNWSLDKIRVKGTPLSVPSRPRADQPPPDHSGQRLPRPAPFHHRRLDQRVPMGVLRCKALR